MDILYLRIWNRIANRFRGLDLELDNEYIKENEDDTD